MNKIKYIDSFFDLPIINGDGSFALLQPFLEFTYLGEKSEIPSKMAITLVFSGEGFGFDFSFSIRMLSYFMVESWLSKEDMHNAHLKMINALQGHLNDKLMDLRIRHVNVPIPTLNQSIELMNLGSNNLIKFVIDFASN